MFKRKPKLTTPPTSPTEYPNSTVVHTEKGYYMIRKTHRLHIYTQRVLDSWRFPRIVETTEAAVVKYPITGKLGFREGTLLLNCADGRMYLVADGKRRHITSPDVFGRLGATHSDLLVVSATEILLHAEGEKIS